jgi:hypothetical protein
LRSADPAERRQARRALSGNVYHQGTRWQASHAVVPFFAELIADPSTMERGELVELLTAIAVGDGTDADLAFDPATEFASVSGEPVPSSVLQRFYDENDLSDEELELVESEVVR